MKADDKMSSDYNASEDSSADDEETIAAQEAVDPQGSGTEIGDLEADQDIPLEELIARYVKKRDTLTDPSEGTSSSGTSGSSVPEDSDISEGEEADEEVSPPSSAKEIDQQLGRLCTGASEVKPNNRTTAGKSKLPFLLRGELREYQEVGLQWLVAMESRKLNGILADEMGLGKYTIHFHKCVG